MSRSAVKLFRVVEGRLDSLVSLGASSLERTGVHTIDRSARSYHYKNHRLLWSYECVRDWREDGENVHVKVFACYSESGTNAEPPAVVLGWRAEVFRTGQASRLDFAAKYEVSLIDLERRGFDVVVSEYLDEGEETVRQALKGCARGGA